MNKQELIDKQALINKLMEIPGVGSNSDALDTIRQFPASEPKKPVALEYVAEWFEEHKDDLEFSIWDLCVDSFNSTETGMLNWIQQPENEPIETLIRMKYGYEIEKEKEPLYYVCSKIGINYLESFYLRGTDDPLTYTAGYTKEKQKGIPFTDRARAEVIASIVGGKVVEG